MFEKIQVKIAILQIVSIDGVLTTRKCLKWSHLKLLLSRFSYVQSKGDCVHFQLRWLESSNVFNFFSTRNVTFDKDITPYIHVFVYHCAYFCEKYGPLKAFEMEALEQLNYVNKLVFFGASNHGKGHCTVTEQVHFIYLYMQ